MNKEKYIGNMVCSFVPDEVSNDIFRTLKSYQNNKLTTVLAGIDITIDAIVKSDAKLSAAVVNSMLLGYMLADLYDDKQLRELVFDKYFDHIQAQRGNNVVDFAKARRERILNGAI